MEPSVTCRHHDPSIAIITLNRPTRRNALTIELMERLNRLLSDLESEHVCRCVILCGAGPAFCAGLDLVEAADLQVAEQSAKWVAQTLDAISRSPLVTIAAVHGAAYAGGAGLMAACDLVVAEEDLRICFPEVRRGLVPALVSRVLRRKLRSSEMRELFLLAEPIEATRARELGLIQRVVSAGQLMEASTSIALGVCKGGPEVVRQTKELIRKIYSVGESESSDAVMAYHANARTGEEAQEGLAAFRERRDPRW